MNYCNMPKILGIGKKLLLQLEVELKLKGCTELSLTTDYEINL